MYYSFRESRVLMGARRFNWAAPWIYKDCCVNAHSFDGRFLLQVHFILDARIDEAIPNVDPRNPENEVLAHLGRLAREFHDAFLQAGINSRERSVARGISIDNASIKESMQEAPMNKIARFS